jgi:hypothetical protein
MWRQHMADVVPNARSVAVATIVAVAVIVGSASSQPYQCVAG